MVTAFAAACHEFVEPEINDVLDDSRLISVNLSQAQTKITNEDIDQQRFVVYIYVDGKAVPEFQNPYNLGYDEDQKRWRVQKSGNWVDLFWNETGEHQFYAFNDVKYYVYGLGYTPLNYDYNNGAPRINLSGINLLQGSNLYNFDLIYTKVVHDVESEGFGSITLPFSHAFSSLLFEVKNEYPVEMSISSISLLNVRATSANSGYYLSFADGLERQGNTADTYSGGSLTIAHGESAIAFGGSVLAWPQNFGGSPFIKLNFNETSKTVDIRSLGIYILDTGNKYHSTITLTPMNLDLEVKELVREYVGGELKSKLTLSLSADKDLSEISDLQITVNKKGGESLGTYTIGTVSSNEVVVEGVANMPEGEYTITYTFKDGINYEYTAESDTFEASVVEPEAPLVPVDPQLGYYVNNNGTFSPDYIAGKSVAKIFWLGDPTASDPELKAKFPNCSHGLAYRVDNNGNCSFSSGKFPSSLYPISPSLMDSNITDATTIRGYSNTLAIRSYISDATFVNILGDCLTSVVEGGTSPWYIPSFEEFEIAFNKDKVKPANQTNAWVSTLYSYYGNYYAAVCQYYNNNNAIKTNYAPSINNLYPCLFILAF